MTYVYEYAEYNPHQHCHKIEVTTGEDLRLGRRAYIDQRCEECRADISEIDRLRALITEWADACDADNDMWKTDPSIGDRAVTFSAMRNAELQLRKAVGR